MDVSNLSVLDTYQTTDATPTERIIYTFADYETLNGEVIVTANDGTDAHFWRFAVGARRVGSGDAEIVGTEATLLGQGSTGASTWTADLDAYDEILVVNITGEVAKNIDWTTYGQWIVTAP